MTTGHVRLENTADAVERKKTKYRGSFPVTPSFLQLCRRAMRLAFWPYQEPDQEMVGAKLIFEGLQHLLEGAETGVEDAICKTPDPSTKDFIMQQTMLRIKDPVKSLDFYTRILGMRLLQELHFSEWEFSIYFVGYCDETDIPSETKERTRWCFQQAGAVELTHNWGTEKNTDLKYHSGNEDPRGFGHIGITVPDVYKACERFEKEGVQFRKAPDGGNMKGLAFIFDPDGYSIEILSANQMAKDFSQYAGGAS